MLTGPPVPIGVGLARVDRAADAGARGGSRGVPPGRARGRRRRGAGAGPSAGGRRRPPARAAVLPLLRDTLVAIADQIAHPMVVTDAQGRVLWREGRPDVLRRAERLGLVEGTRRSGDRTARRLPGTHHAWTGAARPVHDPDNGEVIGALDVTGPVRTVRPTTRALVVAAARLAEGHLAAQLAVRDERLLARNLTHLAALRGEPGALLTPAGRVLAAQPAGRLPPRVALPRSGDRVALPDGAEGVLEPLAEGWLLRLPAAVAARSWPHA
jgi:hypothetical protein